MDSVAGQEPYLEFNETNLCWYDVHMVVSEELELLVMLVSPLLGHFA